MRKLEVYGLIAEIVAAFAVVVSLLFLAFQFREQSAQLERQVGQERLTSFSEARRFFFGFLSGRDTDKGASVTRPNHFRRSICLRQYDE